MKNQLFKNRNLHPTIIPIVSSNQRSPSLHSRALIGYPNLQGTICNLHHPRHRSPHCTNQRRFLGECLICYHPLTNTHCLPRFMIFPFSSKCKNVFYFCLSNQINHAFLFFCKSLIISKSYPTVISFSIPSRTSFPHPSRCSPSRSTQSPPVAHP